MKLLNYIILSAFVINCARSADSNEKISNNPFMVDLNVPIDYANVSASDIEEYANLTLKEVVTDISVEIFISVIELIRFYKTIAYPPPRSTLFFKFKF